jgi:hypothetical protein
MHQFAGVLSPLICLIWACLLLVASVTGGAARSVTADVNRGGQRRHAIASRDLGGHARHANDAQACPRFTSMTVAGLSSFRLLGTLGCRSPPFSFELRLGSRAAGTPLPGDQSLDARGRSSFFRLAGALPPRRER